MRLYHSWNDILVLPDDLIAFAWSAPMRELAARLEMSDVGLKKLLRSNGIVCPPQGHWNRVHAGKQVVDRPKASERRPGETGRLRLDSRFSKVMRTASPMSSAGPFASEFVSEELAQLRSDELKAIRRATVPRSLAAPHPGLRELLAKEERRRQKVAASAWAWDQPKFDNPVAQRRLRILNGIFLALAKRGYGGHASDRDGDLEAHAHVSDTSVALKFGVAGRPRSQRAYGSAQIAPDLQATTPLVFRLNPGRDGQAEKEWRDDDNGKLEQKLTEIVAEIVVEGEAAFRRSLAEAEAFAEQRRIEAQERRQKRLAELNNQRITDLHISGDLLRKAEDIRLLVGRVRQAFAKRADIGTDELTAWSVWAETQADQIDPVLSGQVFAHLRPPTLDEVQ